MRFMHRSINHNLYNSKKEKQTVTNSAKQKQILPTPVERDSV